MFRDNSNSNIKIQQQQRQKSHYVKGKIFSLQKLTQKIQSVSMTFEKY
jgi:hypothetical protein